RAFDRGLERARAAQRRPARGGGAQDLPGIQIRGNVGDSVLSGFDREVAALHRARAAEDGSVSFESARRRMSCSPFDLRDYFFGELPENDRRQADLHIKGCASCREELDQLRSTQAVLLTVPDEEIPQRIGFVSDRVYEPSVVRRWWAEFWGSAPRLGFAAAAMLSGAIILHATHQPAPPVSAPTVDIARLQADFSRQV